MERTPDLAAKQMVLAELGRLGFKNANGEWHNGLQTRLKEYCKRRNIPSPAAGGLSEYLNSKGKNKKAHDLLSGLVRAGLTYDSFMRRLGSFPPMKPFKPSNDIMFLC
jgi:hypothetical protein